MLAEFYVLAGFYKLAGFYMLAGFLRVGWVFRKVAGFYLFDPPLSHNTYLPYSLLHRLLLAWVFHWLVSVPKEQVILIKTILSYLLLLVMDFQKS